MPQLNPIPWFFTLIATWTVFIAFIPVKITKYLYLNPPMVKTHKPLDKPWHWPWP